MPNAHSGIEHCRALQVQAAPKAGCTKQQANEKGGKHHLAIRDLF
jgi:hypothetical protein